MSFRFYKSLVDKYPFTVQILTAGAITTAGDLVAQTITKKKDDRLFYKPT